MAKSIKHKKCKESDCIMCSWHDKFKLKIHELIEQGCPIAHAEIKWYADDFHINVDGKFNTFIESIIYGTEQTRGKNEETFTSIITHYSSTYKQSRVT